MMNIKSYRCTTRHPYIYFTHINSAAGSSHLFLQYVDHNMYFEKQYLKLQPCAFLNYLSKSCDATGPSLQVPFILLAQGMLLVCPYKFFSLLAQGLASHVMLCPPIQVPCSFTNTVVSRYYEV